MIMNGARQQQQQRRRLRVLVITTEGSDRQKYISELFAHPDMVATFEPPAFSPSVSSRTLRNRFEFLRMANEAGLLPPLEWEAILAAQESGLHELHPETFFDCLKDIPNAIEGRRGSKTDVQLHYSCEFWYKAKTINRGRSVMGCTLAHLIAMKRFVKEGFDVMLEDNVRAPVACCATLVSQAKQASEALQATQGVECHFRFLGWLGSVTNLEYILHTHAQKRACYCPTSSDQSSSTDGTESRVGVFPFPLHSHLNSDLDDLGLTGSSDEDKNQQTSDGGDDEDEAQNDKSSGTRHSRPGGNFIWGSYAYWISETAYERLLDTLRKDVGAMLWKGKRARFYSVKPIDKLLPRQIMSLCGAESVQITTHPAWFRAPMLTSKIHAKWDPEFCKSTEFQLTSTGLQWSDLWLSEAEKDAVRQREETGSWAVAPKVPTRSSY